MIPVLTVDEMAAVDAAATEPLDVLVERAGSAVAWAAVGMLGSTYGKRVTIVAGKGNNGADGRVAARRLERRGVRVRVIEAADAPHRIESADLVIDAAYGTGFRGDYSAPEVGTTPVLAVDIPSGINGDTGEASGEAVQATATVTFAALKPGLLLADGPVHAGEITLADIGLDVSRGRAHVVEDADVHAWLPPRDRSAHKWRSAVCVIGGSPGLHGAPGLAAAAAHRGGAGNVRLAVPGGAPSGPPKPISALGADLPRHGWAREALSAIKRCQAVVLGPGLGLDPGVLGDAAAVLAGATVPIVVDADALRPEVVSSPDGKRLAPLIVTPHDAEFTRLAGHFPTADRLGETRALAAALDAVVLLKGPTTVVAAPDGRVLIVTTGDQRLATGGTGDVLSGLIAAFCARGGRAVRSRGRSRPRARMCGPTRPDRGHGGDGPGQPAAAGAGTDPWRLRRARGPRGPTWISTRSRPTPRRSCNSSRRAKCVQSSRPTATAMARTDVSRAAIAGGATRLAVALVEEGVALRKANLDAPILVLSQPSAAAMADVVAHDLVPTRLHRARRRSAGQGGRAARGPRARPREGRHRHAPRRRGPDLRSTLAVRLQEAPRLTLEGFWTHLAVSEDLGRTGVTDAQLDRFDATVGELSARGVTPQLLHAANSGGAIAHPRSRYDLVRCGIALYGYSPGPELADRVSLTPAMRAAGAGDPRPHARGRRGHLLRTALHDGSPDSHRHGAARVRRRRAPRPHRCSRSCPRGRAPMPYRRHGHDGSADGRLRAGGRREPRRRGRPHRDAGVRNDHGRGLGRSPRDDQLRDRVWHRPARPADRPR